MAKNRGKLAYTVYLPNPKGQTVAFGPGDDVPDWAAKLIGDHAYEPSEDDGDTDGPPPKTGGGSGVKAWQAYAAQDEVAEQLDAAGETVEDGASKDAIIAALERAGVATERPGD